MLEHGMFYFADVDEAFIRMAKNTEGLEDGVLVHYEQCIEKNLKGIIQKKYGMINEKYNLVKLLEVLYLTDYPEVKRYKSICRALKDFYQSRRYTSDEYEIIGKEEYEDYLTAFEGLLSVLKEIRKSIDEN